MVLTGNLCRDGAVLKRSAASPRLMQHEGRAVVFNGLQELAERIDDPDLDVTPDDVLVLRNAGPRGAPGMPESGYVPIPRKLARQGVTDMLRISDARMSGTAFGTIVLHAAPEAAIGGALATVQDGDRIRLDVENRRLDLLLDDDVIASRTRALSTTPPQAERGYLRLHHEQIEQAHRGCDLAFLRPPPRATLR